ncbi:MAG: DNA-directed RNA polymerase subunit beta [Bacteroidota bacterium]
MSHRISFSNQVVHVSPPSLLDFQAKSFSRLFQEKNSFAERKKSILYQMLKEHLSISDTKGNFFLEFLDYSIGKPYYAPEQCLEQGITYDVPLKVKLRLTCKDGHTNQETEEEVFLGNIPYMTSRGSFIFKGIERVVISQIKRSYGIFFSKTKHASGATLYGAKVVPLRGIWLEFAFDAHGILYAYIDRRKKVPATLLLRAIGYSSDKDILSLFNLAKEVTVKKNNLKKYLNHKLAARLLRTWTEEFVDEETGEVVSINRSEVVLDRDTIITPEIIEIILNSGEKNIIIYEDQGEEVNPAQFIYKTLLKDDTNTEKEAVENIYYQLRGCEPSDDQEGKEFVQQLFFHKKRSHLGRIGRFWLNKKLLVNVPEDVDTLTREDIVAILHAFSDLVAGKRSVEDADSMTNRIVQASGNLLEEVFNRGIKLTGQYIREELGARDSEDLTPSDLTSGHYITAALHSFYSTGHQSQLMDQVNLLSSVSQIRRITKISNSISRERAGFDARDVHETYYNRICHIKTPEGLNTGLVLEAAIYAIIDGRGALKTPYRKVINGKVDLEGEIVYLAADEEEKVIIAQLTNHIAKDGTLLSDRVRARSNQGEWVMVSPKEVDYIDLSYNQSLSIAATLIPFLEYNETTRVVMSANMQCQSVPLLQPQPPIVGTGQECAIVRDSHFLPTAEEDGIVTYVDATKVIIQPHLPENMEKVLLSKEPKVYSLTKFRPTNQNTCINLKPVVHQGQKIKKGEYLCEGYGIKEGELSLGTNLLVAYMPWRGYNFEDGIVISDRLVKEDVLTSIHIKTFTLELYDTTEGPEEFTADIPNISEEAIRDLDENGVVRVGKEVSEGDILIGKITPQVEASNLTPENKILHAIFGDKAGRVRDSSLRVPNSFKGTVIGTEILSRRKKKVGDLAKTRQEVKKLQDNTLNKLENLRQKAIDTMLNLLDNQALLTIVDVDKKEILGKGGILTKAIVADSILMPIDKDLELLPFHKISNFNWTKKGEINAQIEYLLGSYKRHAGDIVVHYKQQRRKIEVGDEIPVNALRIAKVFVAKKQKIQVGDKLSNKFGNKGVITKIAREEDMPYLEDGTPIDILLNPLGVPSRMNIGQLQESTLGWAGKKLGVKYKVPAFEGPDMNRINTEAVKAGIPEFGLATLYDGFTGKPFENKVTCGVSYILKLNHLVDEKMHARATGPYGYITQQPLGGRGNKGGQRVGEMEVWTLEAYGVANLLREMLTVKSDDLVGRKAAYESIVKGHNIPLAHSSEAFKFLIAQLRGLGVDITFR